MNEPNATQTDAAERILKQHVRNYGNHGGDSHVRTAAFAIYAVMSGKLSKVPQEYRACIEDVIDVKPDVSGKTFTVDPEVERAIVIGRGIEAGPPEGMDYEDMLAVSEAAGELLDILPGPYMHMEMVERLLNAPDHNDDPDDEGEAYTEESLSKLTIAELQDMATINEIDLTGKTKKADIIAAILAAFAVVEDDDAES